MSAALAPVDPRRRTVVTWRPPSGQDPWPAIEAWAGAHGYRPRPAPGAGPAVRVFQRGVGLLTAAMRAQFTLRGGEVELQAWLPISPLARLCSLFILPAEMGIGSGGFRAVLPRGMARKAVNALLAEVGALSIP